MLISPHDLLNGTAPAGTQLLRARSHGKQLPATAMIVLALILPVPAGSESWASPAAKVPLPHLQAEQAKEAPPPPSPDPTTTGVAKPAAPPAQPASSSLKSNGATPGQDSYPVIGQLETITFGLPKPQLPVAERLLQLEKAVFHQTFANLSLADRSGKLKDTILGPAVDPDLPPGAPPRMSAPLNQSMPLLPQNSLPTQEGSDRSGIDPALLATWQQPFFQTDVPREQLEHFALDMVNQERAQQGIAPLLWDDVSYRVAETLVDDLVRRGTVSHLNKAGENPDVRYTKAGGNDAISECLATVGGPAAHRLNRALVARMLHEMRSHQDDRDSLLSSDATHFAFSLALSKQVDKAFSCAEVVTKHAIMSPIPEHLNVGDKVEVKGVLLQPYQFQKVTVAWEGSTPAATGSASSEPEEPQDEAMPYFPPLDYAAYAAKAEHDREKLIALLRTTGMIAAIAGGVFMPPVALAAPLIAMAPISSEPKPAADVPVHGGIKVQGSIFAGTIPVSHQAKEGIYYVTVWATNSDLGHPIPISRRALLVTQAETTAAHYNKAEHKAVGKTTGQTATTKTATSTGQTATTEATSVQCGQDHEAEGKMHKKGHRKTHGKSPSQTHIMSQGAASAGETTSTPLIDHPSPGNNTEAPPGVPDHKTDNTQQTQ